MESSKTSNETTTPQSNGANSEPSPAGQGRWEPRFWENPEQVGICFSSTEELDAAIDWLWSAPEMRDLPRVHVGGNTMIVPAASVDRFREKGYRFTVHKVISAGELPPEAVNRLRLAGYRVG